MNENEELVEKVCSSSSIEYNKLEEISKKLDKQIEILDSIFKKLDDNMDF